MKNFILIIFSSLFILSCQTTSRVTRIDPSIQTDLSGRWNDTDSALVSESIINDLTSSNISAQLMDLYNRKPVLIIGSIYNRSSEHIQIDSFIKDIEKELVNSRKFKLVASNFERDQLRAEKEDQQANSSLETTKRLAQETGADLMLIGNIITINDQINNTRVVYYQINLELIDLENNEKIWIGSKKHKKVIELGGSKW